MHISAIDRAVLAGTVALGLAFASSQAAAWPATVEACHDGDTCTVITDSGQRRHIRLHSVDAPELDQPYGLQARLLINSLVAGQRVGNSLMASSPSNVLSAGIQMAIWSVEFPSLSFSGVPADTVALDLPPGLFNALN